jgi:hypothetical protein
MTSIPSEHDTRTWNALAYVEEYYGGDSIPSDEVAMFQFCVETLRRDRRHYERMLDVGCGPTVHRLAPFARWVDEVHVADYDPRNLDHVRRWVAGSAEAVDWSRYVELTLRLEGYATPPAAVAAAEDRLRRLVTRTCACDVRRADPLGEETTYPLVTTFFCVDCITSSLRAWQEWMVNLLGLLDRGGRILLTALGESDGYPVGRRRFPSPHLTQEDLRAGLVAGGVAPASIRLRTAPLPSEERAPYGALGYVLMATGVRA